MPKGVLGILISHRRFKIHIEKIVEVSATEKRKERERERERGKGGRQSPNKILKPLN